MDYGFTDETLLLFCTHRIPAILAYSRKRTAGTDGSLTRFTVNYQYLLFTKELLLDPCLGVLLPPKRRMDDHNYTVDQHSLS